MLAVGAEMPDVVEMVMGDKDSLERIQPEAFEDKVLLKAAQADSRIYQETGIAVRQEIAVAATAA
jgi:hypothetical protein